MVSAIWFFLIRIGRMGVFDHGDEPSGSLKAMIS
jgi:hypothetical protein